MGPMFPPGADERRIRLARPSLPPLEEYQAAVAEIFASRQLSNSGAWCRRLEDAVARRVGVPCAIGAPSADIGLAVALRAVAARSAGRRRVILPSYTFPSSANAVLSAGLAPVFCDIEPLTLCLEPEAVRAQLDGDTAAILAVHAHGNPADMPALERLAAGAGVALVADAAPAIGTVLDGRHVGGYGDLSVFSFSGTKVLTAGEGGMICCRDDGMAAHLRRLCRYGLGDDYVGEHVGLNGKLAELPAALAFLALPRLDGWLENRRRAVQDYRRRLAGLRGARLQEERSAGARSSWTDLAVIFESVEVAARVATHATARGIDTRPYYRPLHRMPAFAACARGPLDRTEEIADRVVCLPLYNEISGATVALVAGVVREAIG
jgi:dTDP-4-amino-4,6-dideoxygalactose transaminase